MMPFRSNGIRYEEALRLARALGVELDNDIVGWPAEKKGDVDGGPVSGRQRAPWSGRWVARW
jgi:hypothetical protein